jgi:hypothetical protein
LREQRARLSKNSDTTKAINYSLNRWDAGERRRFTVGRTQPRTHRRGYFCETRLFHWNADVAPIGYCRTKDLDALGYWQ